MAVQIIKNLQIKIQNIHFRYEDGYTNPEHPISFGVSLAELQFHVCRFFRDLQLYFFYDNQKLHI